MRGLYSKQDDGGIGRYPKMQIKYKNTAIILRCFISLTAEAVKVDHSCLNAFIGLAFATFIELVATVIQAINSAPIPAMADNNKM